MLNCQNQRPQRRQQQAYLRTFRQPFAERIAREIVEICDEHSTIDELGSKVHNAWHKVRQRITYKTKYTSYQNRRVSSVTLMPLLYKYSSEVIG